MNKLIHKFSKMYLQMCHSNNLFGTLYQLYQQMRDARQDKLAHIFLNLAIHRFLEDIESRTGWQNHQRRRQEQPQDIDNDDKQKNIHSIPCCNCQYTAWLQDQQNQYYKKPSMSQLNSQQNQEKHKPIHILYLSKYQQIIHLNNTTHKCM